MTSVEDVEGNSILSAHRAEGMRDSLLKSFWDDATLPFPDICKTILN